MDHELRTTPAAPGPGAPGPLTEDYYLMQTELARVAGELMRARQSRVDELLEKERLGDRLARLLEVLPGAVLVIDNDGIIVECNQQAREVFGRPLSGQTWAEILRRVRSGQYGGDGVLRLADGRSLSLARRPLESDGGEILLLMDITETERLQALVQQHNRLSTLGEMSARVAHQVRTPLAAAMLYLDGLDSRDALTDERDLRALRRARCRLRDLEVLVNDLLVYASGAPADRTTVDIRELAVTAAELARSELPAGQSIDVDVGDAPVVMNVNISTLQAAIGNLVTNAIQFNGTDGRVRLAVRVRHQCVEISVRDNGPGIPEEFHDRLFEPFFSTRSQGTGLGLAVVRSVAEAHGGGVVVQDLPDGARLSIVLPVSSLPRALSS